VELRPARPRGAHLLAGPCFAWASRFFCEFLPSGEIILVCAIVAPHDSAASRGGVLSTDESCQQFWQPGTAVGYLPELFGSHRR
jgi:hypothetical protein